MDARVPQECSMNSQAMSTPAIFSDGQIKNWLATLMSFIIMKEALHDYIDTNVKGMHNSIKEKVDCDPCGSCSSRDIENWTGDKTDKNSLMWFIPCCKCGEWLNMILAIHTNQHNPNINWKNADIRKWSTDCYHVAKIFMPKGQDKATKMPNDLDAQAVLSLFKYCKWFEKDLPNKLLLSDLLQIRNKVLHSSDLRVTDGNKDKWIDKMIQLLHVLNIRVDVQLELEKLKHVSDGMDFFHKYPEILRIIVTAVQNQERNMLNLEIEQSLIKARLSELEKVKPQLTSQKEADNNLEEVERKLKEQKEEGATRKRRPESAHLKDLKNQTENMLDTLRRSKCIQTRQVDEAMKLFEGKCSIVIRGHPGEGKTTLAFHLIDNDKYRDRRVVLYDPQDWKKVDTDWVDVVVLEDVFGQFDLDFYRFHQWKVYLRTIQQHVDVGKFKVIITTRHDILSKAYSKLGSLKLFSDDLSLMLSSKQLKESEKISILNRQLQRHKKNMKEEEKEKCISNFSGLIGFPQCCSIFAGDSKSFNIGPEFFGYPEKFFVENISQLDDTGLLSLAFLFCNGKICEDNLSLDTMPETSKQLLMELASHLHISGMEAAITLLRDAYDNFLELYVVKSMSYKQTYIKFTHATVCEAVGHVLGDRCPEMVVKYGDSEYLYQRTYTAKVKNRDSDNVFIPVSVYGLLVERMVHDVVNRELVENIAKHSALEQEIFLEKLKCKLNKANRIKDFFMAVPEFSSKFADPYYDDDSIFDVLEGDCITFMQYILQRDEGLVKSVYSQLLEFLKCAHKKNSSNCWRCIEKQNLLELALYYHHFQIADELIDMKASYTHVSLCNTARHGELRRVKTILETLNRNCVFNPGYKEAKDALCRAYISGKRSLIELLLKEGIILDTCHVVDAVQHGNMNVVMKVVEHLKYHEKWKPHLEKCSTYSDLHCSDVENTEQIPYSRALFLTYFHEKFEIADYLLRNEVEVSMNMFVDVSANSSQQAVARVMQKLKDTKNWDPKCDDASKALKNAYYHQRYDVCDLLDQEGVSLTLKNLLDIAYSAPLEHIRSVIQHLKNAENWDPSVIMYLKH